VGGVFGHFTVEARFGLFAEHGVVYHLAVNFTEHDVHRADDGHGVGQHVASAHFIHGGQVREARGADLQAVRLVGAVAGQVDAELTLGVFHGCIGLAFGHAEAFGEQLEVVDELLHGALHLHARRG